MSESKKYSVVYSYTTLEGLQKAISNVLGDHKKFKDLPEFDLTFIPHFCKEGDPLAQMGYYGGVFKSKLGPKEEYKDSFGAHEKRIPCDEGAKV